MSSQRAPTRHARGDLGEGEPDIARDLVKAVRSNLSTDWTARDDAQAKSRSIIKRLLAKHGYRPTRKGCRRKGAESGGPSPSTGSPASQ